MPGIKGIDKSQGISDELGNGKLNIMGNLHNIQSCTWMIILDIYTTMHPCISFSIIPREITSGITIFCALQFTCLGNGILFPRDCAYPDNLRGARIVCGHMSMQYDKHQKLPSRKTSNSSMVCTIVPGMSHHALHTCYSYTIAASGLRVAHEWLSFDRPRARSASGLSKLKPRVCNS